MVDLKTQYLRLKTDIDAGIQAVLDSTEFIGGQAVANFKAELEAYLGPGNHVVPCANGTDALQIAFMALGLKPGDEVIVPTFTYVATAEVIALLGLKPVMVDVDPDTFNIGVEQIESAISPRTRAIVPVHLFGQSVDLQPIMDLADHYKLYVIEDNAQAIGADYQAPDGRFHKTGTVGHIGSTSFFPSKNLGCYGDGGAMCTRDARLAEDLRMVANHGQSKLYMHEMIGVNSRLDGIQAAVLRVKLRHLDEFAAARQQAAAFYDAAFADISALQTPVRAPFSTHVFHQYTLRVRDGRRDKLRGYLQERGIPAMIYYPIPLYRQPAFAKFWKPNRVLPVTEMLCREVISLPMHTELTAETLGYITDAVREFFK